MRVEGRPYRLILILSAGLGPVNCARNPPPSPIGQILGKDWNCRAAPSAFDGAGWVFRVDNSNQDRPKYTVRDYSQIAGVNVKPAPNLLGKQDQTMDANLIAKLLKLPVGVTIRGGDSYTVTQSYTGAQEANVTDDGANAVKAEFYHRPDLGPRNTYWLVRGSITATAVKYDFNRDIRASFSADIPIKVVTLSPNVSGESVTHFEYDDKFPEPVNVCIKPELLPYPPPSPGAPAAPLVAAAPPEPVENLNLFGSLGR